MTLIVPGYRYQGAWRGVGEHKRKQFKILLVSVILLCNASVFGTQAVAPRQSLCSVACFHNERGAWTILLRCALEYRTRGVPPSQNQFECPE